MKLKMAAAAASSMLVSVVGVLAFTAGPAQANTCSVTPKAGVSAVNIRGDKSAIGTPDGVLYSGHFLGSKCQSESGGYYSSCGGGSYWFWVDYGLFSRYVAASCVRLYVDRA